MFKEGGSSQWASVLGTRESRRRDERLQISESIREMKRMLRKQKKKWGEGRERKGGGS